MALRYLLDTNIPSELVRSPAGRVTDLTLVTANTREFERVPSLRNENWLIH